MDSTEPVKNGHADSGISGHDQFGMTGHIGGIGGHDGVEYAHWRILPIIISFTGIFAVSMSGAALYTMMGALLNRNGNNQKPTNPMP